MAPRYQVTRTVSAVYLDENGNVVKGYTLYVDLIQYREQITVDVPTLDPEQARAKIEALVDNRDKLAALQG